MRHSFFKLTNSILLEYIPWSDMADETLSIKYPEIIGRHLSMNRTCVVEDYKYYKSKYIFIDDFQTDFESMTTNCSKSNTVFSMETNKGSFIDAGFDKEVCYLDIDRDFTNTRNMKYSSNEVMNFDTIILHFTRSGLDLSGYKSYIFEIKNYTTLEENNLVFASVLLNADSKYILNARPECIDGKLYVKKMVFRIPSVSYLNDADTLKNFRGFLKPNDLNGSYCKASLLGVKNISVQGGIYNVYNTEFISAANITELRNRDIALELGHAQTGEYFVLRSVANDGSIEMSDYLRSQNDSFIMDYKLTLTEYYVSDSSIEVLSKVTDSVEYVKSFDIAVDDNTCNEEIFYRPTLKMNNAYYFVLSCEMTLTSVSDGNSSVFNATYEYGRDNGENVSIYGKNIRPYINKSSNLLSVNVYNKRKKDDEMMPVLQVNSTASLNQKATTVNISSFIESTDILVSVSDVTTQDITIE